MASTALSPGGAIEAGLRELITSIVREELAAVRADGGAADEYLSTDAAGDFAKVAPGTIRRWIREGRLVGYRAGRLVRVRRADLERLLRESGPDQAELSPEERARRDFA